MASAAKGQEYGKASAPARKASAPKAVPSAKGSLQERIKQRAYELWEADGRPHGKDAEHWARAERELTQSGARQPSAKTGNGKASNGAAAKTAPRSPSAASKPGAAKPAAGTSPARPGGPNPARPAGPGSTKKG
jgi:hypothetical protein